MLQQEITDLINTQINLEFYSAYLYLYISNYYYDENLDGFGNWFKVQAQEEKDHAILFITYMQNNDEHIKLNEIKAPSAKYSNFKEPLTNSLEHERAITKKINNIYAKAHESKDFRTMQFLDWFIKEQGEEENTADDLCKKFDLFGSEAKGLYLLNSELASRVYTAPTLVL